MTRRTDTLPMAVFYHLTIICCCCLVLLVGCGSVGSGRQRASSAGVPATPPIDSGPRQTMTGVQRQIIEQAMLVNREHARAEQILQGMTLDQKLGQLIMVEYLGTDYQGSGLQYMIQQEHVGGFMYQASNSNFDAPYNQIADVAAFSQQAQQDTRIPLLIATDQEGGLVNRLYTFHGYLPSAQEMAATGNPHEALNQGQQDAIWLRQLGINTDLAPVVDVQTVDPPVLESRMFGSDPQTVANYAGAFLYGLQQNGVAGCLKHFPGLGAVTSDPHAGLPVVNRNMAQLEQIDLEPYKLLLSSEHPAMVMATDVLMPAIDPNLPAELSPEAINGVLRGQLGYQGVVITDGLYMQGISDQWSLSQAAVLAIVAGDDIVEGPYTSNQVAGVIAALKGALQQGQLSVERINQSVLRILLLKMQYGLLK